MLCGIHWLSPMTGSFQSIFCEVLIGFYGDIHSCQVIPFYPRMIVATYFVYFASYECWPGVLSSMTLIEQERTLIPEVLSVRCPAQTSGPDKHLTLTLTTIIEDTNAAEREKRRKRLQSPRNLDSMGFSPHRCPGGSTQPRPAFLPLSESMCG